MHQIMLDEPLNNIGQLESHLYDETKREEYAAS